MHPLSVLAAALLIVCAAPATAADRAMGSFKDWSTMVFGEGKSLTCMAFTQPAKSEGDYSKRGDVFVFITHRPAAGERNQVSVETGYTYDTRAPVTLAIDGREFLLRADGSTAWLSDDTQARALVEAMRGGRVMQVQGTSARGTRTTDDYSLLGFTAATRAIDEACR